MQLKELMTTHVQGISADQSVCEAAQAMQRLGVGSVPVFRDGQPIGIVTDRDIVVRAVAEQCDCSQKPIGEIMTGELITMPETTSIAEAAKLMEQQQIRRLLVTGSNNEIVGIVSVGDIVAKSGEHGLAAELIEMVSLPAEPAR